MSTLSYGLYENRLAASEAKARQAERDNFKPYMACHSPLALKSIEYKPTYKGKARWIGQVMPMAFMVDDLPITLWQEDIDFLNKATGLNIGAEPMDLENELIKIVTPHCHSKFGLNRMIYIQHKANHYYKDEVMSDPEPTPTPIAQAKPQRRGYLHLRDLLQKNGVVSLPHGDALTAKMHVLTRMGYAVASKHNQWVATPKPEPATVADVKVLDKPVKHTAIGTCRLYRGIKKDKLGNITAKGGLMVREYEIVEEIDTDRYRILDPVVGGTFVRGKGEIELVNISLQAVA